MVCHCHYYYSVEQIQGFHLLTVVAVAVVHHFDYLFLLMLYYSIVLKMYSIVYHEHHHIEHLWHDVQLIFVKYVIIVPSPWWKNVCHRQERSWKLPDRTMSQIDLYSNFHCRPHYYSQDPNDDTNSKSCHCDGSVHGVKWKSEKIDVCVDRFFFFLCIVLSLHNSTKFHGTWSWPFPPKNMTSVDLSPPNLEHPIDLSQDFLSSDRKISAKSKEGGGQSLR